MKRNERVGTAGGKGTRLRTVGILLFWLVLMGVTEQLLLPVYSADSLPEGALIAGYYREQSDHQVLFLGDCEIYESVIPAVLWESAGISSYVRGSPQQMLWQSYYLLRDALRYETPDTVVLGVYGMVHGEPGREAYNRLTLDGMELSVWKVAAVQASLGEDENAWSYYLPLLRYHDRWRTLGPQTLAALASEGEPVGYEGYLLQSGVAAADPTATFPELYDSSLPLRAWEYLEKTVALCREKGIRLVLLKPPSCSPAYPWYEDYDRALRGYAHLNGLPYWNANDAAAEMGLDWTRDTYDGGIHLNVEGAEKLTRWLGRELAALGARDERQNAALARIWAAKVARYEVGKAAARKEEA